MGCKFYAIIVIMVGISTFPFSASPIGGGLLSIAIIGSGFTMLIF